MNLSFFNVIAATFMFGGRRGEGEGFYISLVMKIGVLFTNIDLVSFKTIKPIGVRHSQNDESSLATTSP
jgi:hypothetical protein